MSTWKRRKRILMELEAELNALPREPAECPGCLKPKLVKTKKQASEYICDFCKPNLAVSMNHSGSYQSPFTAKGTLIGPVSDGYIGKRVTKDDLAAVSWNEKGDLYIGRRETVDAWFTWEKTA